MIRRPPRSTLDRSSAASDVYKRQILLQHAASNHVEHEFVGQESFAFFVGFFPKGMNAVSYTHLGAHETVLDLVCRLLLEKKNKHLTKTYPRVTILQTKHYHHFFALVVT